MNNLSEKLSQASKSVNEVLLKMLESPPASTNLYEASRHLIKAGGKRLRPFLVLTSCEIVGGQRELALNIAAAIEFIHNFTLVHDDIMDQDTKRRGKPTVHTVWGIPLAILVGDILFAKAYESVLSQPHPVTPQRILQVLDIITESTIAICEGQAQDMLFEEKDTISEAEYFEMINKKTATLLEASTKVGAIVSGGTPTQVQRLGRFASYSGLAFQIIDDILGLTATEEVLGKPVGSDIREGKKTLIMIHALSHANPSQKEQIQSILGKNNASLTDLETTVNIVKSLGSIDYAFKKAENYVSEAKKQLYTFPSSKAKDDLLDLADYIIRRTY